MLEEKKLGQSKPAADDSTTTSAKKLSPKEVVNEAKRLHAEFIKKDTPPKTLSGDETSLRFIGRFKGNVLFAKIDAPAQTPEIYGGKPSDIKINLNGAQISNTKLKQGNEYQCTVSDALKQQHETSSGEQKQDEAISWQRFNDETLKKIKAQMTRPGGLAKQPTSDVPRELSFYHAGGAMSDTHLDYVSICVNAAPNFRTTIWADPHAYLINETKRLINAAAGLETNAPIKSAERIDEILTMREDLYKEIKGIILDQRENKWIKWLVKKCKANETQL